MKRKRKRIAVKMKQAVIMMMVRRNEEKITTLRANISKNESP